jgi:U3 small nucleolar RNA-associated protein 20
MVSHLDPTLLERYLVHILTPVYRIIDEDSIRDAHIGAILIV